MLPWCLNAAKSLQTISLISMEKKVSSILKLISQQAFNAITHNCKMYKTYTTLYSSIICYLRTGFNNSTRNISTHVIHLYLAVKFRLQVSAIQTYYIYKISSDTTLQDVKKRSLSKFCNKVKIRLQSSWTQTCKYLLKSKNNSSIHIQYGNDKSVNHVQFSYGKHEITNIYVWRWK